MTKLNVQTLRLLPGHKTRWFLLLKMN